ncbi:hypothetical protein KR074_003158, partial [Drosophila pseudoananassae]
GPGGSYSTQRKGSYKDRRRAAFILMRADTSAEANPDQAEIIKWAREILPDFNPEKAGVRQDPSKRTGSDPAKETAQSAKRQRSTEAGAPHAKKRMAQPQPSNRSFAEEMLRCGGPPPECEDAGWYQGSVKVIDCQDARSVETYKRMVASLGVVYPGAKLAAVDWDEIPSKPRARVWLTEKPADAKTILTMLRMCNPTLSTADWRVAKVEKAEGLRRQVVLILNEETVKALERTEHRLKYGFEHVSARIYKSDAKAKLGGIGLEADTQEPDLEEPTEEGHPEEMSDEEEDILKGYTSE